MIEIAGDMLEGGGQIIRTSIALAALAGVDVRVTKIRDNRPNPGLQPQHVTAVTALAKICNAQTEGLTQGSRELIFRPRGHMAGKFRFDVGTAGSIPLILQALMPCLAFAPDPVELELIGGTDVKWSPSIDYVQTCNFTHTSIDGIPSKFDCQPSRPLSEEEEARSPSRVLPLKMLHAIHADQTRSTEIH